MKFDLARRSDTGTARTLISLRGALSELLKAEAFETVSIQSICAASLIPRSTFYNYFSDKYDLLDYYLHSLFDAAVPQKTPRTVFGAMDCRLRGAYEYIDANRTVIDEILRKNGDGGYFFRSARHVFLSGTEQALSAMYTGRGDGELTAYFCAHTLWELIELKLSVRAGLSADDACAFLASAINREKLMI